MNHSEIPNGSNTPGRITDVYALAEIARNSGACVHDFEVVEQRHALDELVREAQAWGMYD